MRNPYKQLEAVIGYRFRRKKHLEAALTHRSFRFEKNDLTTDNQRLEFLGDAVLGLLAADYLYQKHQDVQEGELTKLRSCLANSRTLAKIANSIDLGDFLKLGKGELQSGGSRRPSNLSDGLEAIIGAAYVDGGIAATSRIFKKLFLPEAESLEKDAWTTNPKGSLQEYAQLKWKVSPKYRIVSEDGPAHSKLFTSEVVVNDKVLGKGEGSNKRSAEVAAARQAMTSLSRRDSRAWKVQS